MRGIELEKVKLKEEIICLGHEKRRCNAKPNIKCSINYSQTSLIIIIKNSYQIMEVFFRAQ